MPGAFDPSAFDPAAFDTAGEVYGVELPISVTVSDARVFDSSVGSVAWDVSVFISGIDVSADLCGTIEIEAAEDAARICTFDFVVRDVALLGVDGASVRVDVTISGGGYSARRRRFTGVVERVEYQPANRVATMTCRDGYQERVRACTSAAEVKSLLTPGAVVSDKIAQWDDAEPDAWGYFQGVLATVPGATYIDGAGVWRVVQWGLSVPAQVYDADDMFDPGPTLERAARADLPDAIIATLTHDFPRLHCAALSMYWQGLVYTDYLKPLMGRGIDRPGRDQWEQALGGLGDWYLASADYVNFDWISLSGDDPEPAEVTAVMYRRWYQQVSRKYSVSIPMGGTSGRTDTIAHAISTAFDAAEWESGGSQDSAVSIYRANAPDGTPAPADTGLAALPGPYPPSNEAIDHFGDLTADDISTAMAHVVAEATRKAAQGRRQQRVTISRPVDLRVDIGVVVKADALGVVATGQVSSYSERYDHDAGSVVGEYVIACADGTGDVTASAVNLVIPAPSVVHALVPPTLGNWIGASGTDTYPYLLNTDTICGALGNVDPASDDYNAERPVYEPQVRIVMPEIPAALRDPIDETVDVDALIDIAGNSVIVSF